MDTKEKVILHISDLHFGLNDKSSSKHIRDRDDVLKSFIECFSQFEAEEKEWKPDILAITGDVGFKGTKKNYIEAEKFISEIIDSTGNNITKADIVICAGNHDVNLPNYSAVLPLKDSDELPEACPQLTIDKITKVSDKFSNFSDFLLSNQFSVLEHDKFIARSKQQKKAGALFGFRQVKGINFLVLNSEWDFFGCLSGLDDYDGYLRVGPDLLADSINKMRKVQGISPVFALMHHPPQSLWRVEQGGYIENDPQSVWDLLNTNVNVLLHGHTHKHSSNSRLKENTEIFSCSSLHSSDVNFYEAWLIKVKWNNKFLKLSAVPYKWNRRTNLLSEYPHGKWTIDKSKLISREMKFTSSANNPVIEIIQSAIDKLFELRSFIKTSNDEEEKTKIQEIYHTLWQGINNLLPQLDAELANKFKLIINSLSTTNEIEENSPSTENPEGQARVLSPFPGEIIEEQNKKGTK